MNITKKTVSELDVDTRAVYDKLISAQENETITYAELSELIGRNIQQQARPMLDFARRMAFRENKILFDTIYTIGVKRLDDIGKVGTYEHTMRNIKTKAYQGRKKIFSVDNFNALPNELKVKHNAAASLFGAINLMAEKSSMKKIELKVTTNNAALPIGKTMELFR